MRMGDSKHVLVLHNIDITSLSAENSQLVSAPVTGVLYGSLTVFTPFKCAASC